MKVVTRPTGFDEFVGQEKAKTVLSVLTMSAKRESRPVPHVLLSGPSGCGKTSMARIVAKEIGGNFIELNAASITQKNILQMFKRVKQHDVVFFDEIHRMTPKTAEAIYTIMEDFFYVDGKDGKIQTYRVPPFTLFGATTEMGSLLKPLRNRFKFTAEFETYNLDDLTEIVHMVSKKYGFKLSDKAARTIAQTSRFTPRIVVSRTEWIRDYMITKGLKTMSADGIIEAVKLQGFDENGFTNLELQYMKLLEEYEFMSLNKLCSMLNVSSDTLTNEVEPYLMQTKKIGIETRGRYLL